MKPPIGSRVRHIDGRPFTGKVTRHSEDTDCVRVAVDPEFRMGQKSVWVDSTCLTQEGASAKRRRPKRTRTTPA